MVRKSPRFQKIFLCSIFLIYYVLSYLHWVHYRIILNSIHLTSFRSRENYYQVNIDFLCSLTVADNSLILFNSFSIDELRKLLSDKDAYNQFLLSTGLKFKTMWVGILLYAIHLHCDLVTLEYLHICFLWFGIQFCLYRASLWK